MNNKVKDLSTFSRRIKELRKSKKLSQQELAKRMNVDARQISLYENEKSAPSVEALIKLSQVFQVSLDYLILENAVKAKNTAENDELIALLKQQIQEFDEKDRNYLIYIIDVLSKKNKIKQLVD